MCSMAIDGRPNAAVKLWQGRIGTVGWAPSTQKCQREPLPSTILKGAVKLVGPHNSRKKNMDKRRERQNEKQSCTTIVHSGIGRQGGLLTHYRGPRIMLCNPRFSPVRGFFRAAATQRPAKKPPQLRCREYSHTHSSSHGWRQIRSGICKIIAAERDQHLGIWYDCSISEKVL